MKAVKVIEAIGFSEKSFDDALKNVLEKTSESVKNSTGMDVKGMKCEVKDNKITQYKVIVKVAFMVE